MDEYEFYSGKVTGEEIDSGIFYALYDGIYIAQTPELTGTGVGTIGMVWNIPSTSATRRRPQPSDDDYPVQVWFSNPDAVIGNVNVSINMSGGGGTFGIYAKILGTTSITVVMAKAHPLIPQS